MAAMVLRHKPASPSAALLACLLAVLLSAHLFAPMPLCAATPRTAAVGLLSIDGAIGPASADHVARGIAGSASRGHGLLVQRMDAAQQLCGNATLERGSRAQHTCRMIISCTYRSTSCLFGA